MNSSLASISGKTKIIGILGWPVEHSFSPRMHNAAFQALGLDFAYLPFPTAPDNLAEAVAGIRALGICGVNVTIPHKEGVIPYLDELSPLSQKMGTVNTIYWEEGRLIGTTTDPYGALANLRHAGFEPNDHSLAIVGSGGAARAIAFAFATEYPRMPLTIVFRKEDCLQAEQLAEELSAKTEATVRLLPLEKFSSQLPSFHLVINATPVGMHPLEGKTPFDTSALLSSQWVYDIIYNPRETQLLLEAAQQGCHTVGGLGMLLHQGARSFQLWTGCEAPIDVMTAALQLG